VTPTADEALAVLDVLDRARKLPPELRESIAHELLDELGIGGIAPPRPDHVREAWKEEIARRIAAYQRGEVQTMTVEEVEALLEADQREDERRAG
jgi:putative addiction module component (TIGR02574 family)